VWIWSAVNHFDSGLLDWTVGDRSAATFAPLWQRICCWNCYFWVSDGWRVYDQFLPDEDRIIAKTYMTRVEGENSRLRHYLGRLRRKSFCYSKSLEMLKMSIRLLVYYLRYHQVPLPTRHPDFLS
jgi:insertion element IS1 protein InsB